MKRSLSIAKSLKTIKTYFHRHEAQIAQGLLKANGIETTISGDDTAGYNLSIGTGNFKLLVKEEDFKQAEKILANTEKPAHVEDINSKKSPLKLSVTSFLVIILCAPLLALIILPLIPLSQSKIICKEVIQEGKGRAECTAFYKNGGIFSVYSYVANKVDGQFRVFHPNGKIELEYSYLQDLTEGPAKSYFDNGQLSFESTYKNNKLEGPAREYYESGKLKRTLNYKNNQINGLLETYFESGKLAEQLMFKNGHRLTKDGSYLNGIEKLYYENGQLWEEWSYKDGLLEGAAKQYYENGQLRVVDRYRHNMLHGITKEFYKNGKIKNLYKYKNDINIEMRRYDPDGHVIFKSFY